MKINRLTAYVIFVLLLTQVNISIGQEYILRFNGKGHDFHYTVQNPSPGFQHIYHSRAYFDKVKKVETSSTSLIDERWQWEHKRILDLKKADAKLRSDAHEKFMSQFMQVYEVKDIDAQRAKIYEAIELERKKAADALATQIASQAKVNRQLEDLIEGGDKENRELFLKAINELPVAAYLQQIENELKQMIRQEAEQLIREEVKRQVDEVTRELKEELEALKLQLSNIIRDE